MKVQRMAPGCIVLDIDDTIIKADASSISIYKVFPDGHEEALSTEEFAKDPDAIDGGKAAGVHYDYRDFNDPEKILKSIEQGTPLIKNLKIMDKYVNKGWDIVFLTARSQGDLLYKILQDILMYRDNKGVLQKLGSKLKYCAAINDTFRIYKGANDSEKKANVLRNLCYRYDKVLFIDDDEKNVRSAMDLKLPNLKVVRSWNESLQKII